MRSTLQHLAAFAVAVTGALVLLVCPAHGFGRFEATLDWPPSYITPYQSSNEDFSIALGAKPNPEVIGERPYEPKLNRASFADHSLTFVQQYARIGRDSKDLIPVSVDADEYMHYRLDKSLSDSRRSVSKRAMTDSGRRKEDRGLGIKVALPKRLDAIFGEGGAGLTVSGYRRITFSGRSQWTDASESDTYSQSKFPSLNMEQISRFDITGTIGSKISVKVSQDSQTDIPLENRIQIRYKGDEDDILKTIEAGNTNLNLPNTQFVGYSSRITGLFGIKTEAQIGNLSLTAIASQEKGTSDQATFSPTGEESADDVRDYEYAVDRIFDLGLEGELDSADVVTNLFVFEQETDDDNLEAYNADMYVYPNDTTKFTAERMTSIRVKEVDPTRYTFFNDTKRGLHYMVFTTTRAYKAFGVWMVVKRVNGTIDTLGSIVAEPYRLKLIRPYNQDPDNQTWQLMWRNCYDITRGASIDGLTVTIYKGNAGTEKTTSIKDYQEQSNQTQSYLEILGLDQYNTTSGKIPDGVIDDRVEIFRPEWGLIIFPEREPFNSTRTFSDSLGRVTQKLDELVPDIYSYYSTTSQQEASRYFIRIISKDRSSVISLDKPNIIDGSERITVNGHTLTRGTDYDIDYNFGRVTLKSEEALDPNADISIDYEYAPFLSLQKKTLFGARAEYEWSKDLSFGSTVLYKSDQAQERKPRVGEETSKMLVYDVDATLKLRPNFLTSFVDALPLLNTKQASGITISGEVAQSHPNPNVDGVAYVDDFESALEQLSLGVSRTSWQLASPPEHIDVGNYLRGKVLWFQPRDAVLTQDVYDVDIGRGEGSLRTMKFIFRPRHDSVAVSVNEDTTALVLDTLAGQYHSWGGIMRRFSGVDEDRVQLFEIRMRGSKRGKLHFDFGRISEDANSDGAQNTEDMVLENSSLETEEDRGLDTLFDYQEPNYIPGVNVDPNGDNWYFEGDGKCPLPSNECNLINWDDESIRYEWINGTEGNMNDPSVQGRPDEEQLSSVSGFNWTNAYFSFVIDLDDDAEFLVEGSEKGGADNPWRTYRIPIRDTTILDQEVSDGSTDPNWANITHVRVWFEDTTYSLIPDTIEVAGWYFVQSNWADSVDVHDRSRDLADDDKTRFVVASVSEEDGTYTPPPEVEAYTDPSTGLTEAQRGLLLHFENLNFFDTCLATKVLSEVETYSGYRHMEMYVHGGDGIITDPNGDQQVGLFMRIGQDSANFYEVRKSVYPGWDSRNDIDIDFNELTAVKDSLIRNLPDDETEIDGESGNYRVLGYPNLSEIKYFVIGVANRNLADTVGGATGNIWVDELRVTDVRNDVGTAARISVNGNLADLFTYRFGYQTQDPYFRSVSTATRGGSGNNLGSGKTQTSYNWNVTFNVDRFMPKFWGANIPISYSYSKSTTIPLLRTSSDIVLPDEIREQEKSVSETRNFTISEKFAYKGKNLLFILFLNRQDLSVSYRRTLSTSPTAPYSFGENISVKSGFDLSMKTPPTLSIFFWTKWIPIARRVSETELGLYPTRWSLSATYTRNASISDDVNYNRRSSLKRDLVGSMDISYNLFQNFKTTYRYTTKRDLSDLSLVNWSLKNLKLGLETSYTQAFSATYDPKLFEFLSTSFSYKANYSDTYDKSSESLLGKLSRDMGVTGTFDHIKLFGGNSSGGQRRFRGRRASTRSGSEKQQEESGKPFYDPALSVLRFLTGWIKAPTYGYSENFSNQLPGMVTRPSWAHRFGLEDYPDVDTVTATRSPSASEGETSNLGSGFTFLGGLSVDAKYSRSVTRDLITTSSRYEKISTKWPTLTIRIARFEKLPIIRGVVNKLIEVFDPRTGYSRSTRETIDLDAGHTTSTSESISYSPLISFNFKVFRKLTLTTKYTLTRDRNENFNLASGKSEKITKSSKKSLDFSTSYSFSAPGGIGIPLFGKMKFNSQMSIQLRATFNSSLSETYTQSTGKWAPSSDKSDMTWSASAKYSFSQQVNGGLTMRWQDSNDATSHRKSHVRELQLWAELRF
ncbi:MAG TPA: cell surface protein SprA [candidate division Zixibacteria bacterium]|nr:cell surface protein SprA [candidate division Zixibacteria bacterium]